MPGGEGPGGNGEDSKDEPIDGVSTAFDTVGEGHTLSVVDKGDGKGKILMASANPEELNRKSANVKKTMQAYESDPAIPDDFKLEIMIMAEALEERAWLQEEDGEGRFLVPPAAGRRERSSAQNGESLPRGGVG